MEDEQLIIDGAEGYAMNALGSAISRGTPEYPQNYPIFAPQCQSQVAPRRRLRARHLSLIAP